MQKKDMKGVVSMVAIPAKTKERIIKGLRKFQPILKKAKSADVNESDTVMIIADIFADVFGYDKFLEITSEFAIKSTFCDLAIKLDGKVAFLIECKAIGLDLKEDFVRQAIDYAANSGIEWVVLTNGINWKVFKVVFAKPIDKELVYEFDFTILSSKKQSDLEFLYYLSKEAFIKSSKTTLEDVYAKNQIINKFIIGQFLLATTTLDLLRKHFKKMSSDSQISNDELYAIINSEVLKREVVEGEKAIEAKKKVRRMEIAMANKKGQISKKSD